MREILSTALIDFGIYSLFVLLYTFVGAYQNINIWGMKWDWKTWLNGLVKWLALGGIIVGTALGVFLLLDQANRQGVDIVNAQAIAPRVIFSIMLLGSGYVAAKIIAKLATKLGISDEQLQKIMEQSVNTDPGKILVLNLEDIPMPSEDYIKAKLASEQEGGIGRIYSVPIDTFAAFMAAVLGNSYDIDGAFNSQCWDGAALLWQQLGLILYTGNGLAIGCWDLKRDVNRYDKFDLVTDVNSLKPGDAVCMRPNHIGFFVGWNGAYMQILGQNQNTNGNGGPFTIVNIAKSAFAGAFRYKAWNIAVITAATAPAAVAASVAPMTVPNNPEPVRDISVGESVIAWGVGTADSYGGGATTRDFPETTMRVIGVNNGRYGLNQYNQGTAGVVADVTGWWASDHVRKG